MANALAIAAVTAVLKSLLENELIRQGVSSRLNSPDITVLPPNPDLGNGNSANPDRLNLFLMHTTPNLGWRNVDLPSRNGRGDRLRNAPLALDLHYLVTAYSDSPLHAEVLLGVAMQFLHEHPILTRTTIRTTLDTISGDPLATGEIEEVLADTGLADQVEQLRITPTPMMTEEISRLWSAIQTPYYPSTAYHISLVLIEPELPALAPLPVLTIGEPIPDRERSRGVQVQPHLQPPVPTLQAAIAPNQQPAIQIGETLTLRGHHLDGAEAIVEFVYLRSGRSLELAATSISDTALTVDLPTDPAPPATPADSPVNPENWRAGLYSVTARVRPAGEPDFLITNTLPLVLAPQITSVVQAAAGDTLTLNVGCSPPVHDSQQVQLAIGTQSLPAQPFAPVTRSLVFQSDDLPSGDQWLRLRIDGIESLLIDRSTVPPQFRPSQRITLP